MVRKKKITTPVPTQHSIVAKHADKTVGELLLHLLKQAGVFTTGDQTPPCVILWPDPERQWERSLDALKALLPELHVLGTFQPEARSGPAIWLRCIEARTIEPILPNDRVPVFYLPGVSRQQLREVEDCPAELQPLVELQFRGSVWAHPNGKDWTPVAFLTSEHGGLGLDVARDVATAEALKMALPLLLPEKRGSLVDRKITSEFLHSLLSPDLPGTLLRWMNDPTAFRKNQTAEGWGAFCHRCVDSLRLHPEKDGELCAAEHLGEHHEPWKEIWERFAEAPHRYPGVVTLLEKADPMKRGIFGMEPEYWPKQNDQDEEKLADELSTFPRKSPDEAANAVRELEHEHGLRRKFIWRDLGKSKYAVALEHLDSLAELTKRPLAAPKIQGLGEAYALDGWKADAAALKALAIATTTTNPDGIAGAVKALYLHWLEETAKNLQTLFQKNKKELSRLKPLTPEKGRVVLFADGLRFDLARSLESALKEQGTHVDLTWDWAPIPSVTATAKPWVSPIASLLKGGEVDDEFGVFLSASNQRLTQDRFENALKEQGWRLEGDAGEIDYSGFCWLETGSLDKRGHNEGWRLAGLIEQELEMLQGKIKSLLAEGWQEVVVVTDHGWLLMPGGFPKVQLPKCLAEHRWGRCAALKTGSTTEIPTVPWFWNDQVTIASPSGVGTFKAGLEYVHGGISLQELVIPRLTVRRDHGTVSASIISKVKWVGLRCRVSVENVQPGQKIDIRLRPADPGSSRIDGMAPRDVASDGTASLLIANDGDDGMAVVIVLLGQTGQVIHSQPTIIGGKE